MFWIYCAGCFTGFVLGMLYMGIYLATQLRDGLVLALHNGLPRWISKELVANQGVT